MSDASDPEPLHGYLAVLRASGFSAADPPTISGCRTDHLADGDIVSMNPSGFVRTLYRRASKTNSLFATERCDSFCLMCSQPPREVDDSHRVAEMLAVVELVDPLTEALGITGGEPTLLGQGLLDVIAACRDRLPATSLHVLSNGRRFIDASYAEALAHLCHHDLMMGIPVYSDLSTVHDYVVQARGAFNQTIAGLHNLARCQVPVEIRIVVHRQTFERLPQLARFIYRNLTFAAHVTFMGLEVIGFAKPNIRTLWIDPLDYRDQLEEAVFTLTTAGMNVSIYNHQLCTVPETLWGYCRRSISDWKNEYAPECAPCEVKDQCGGFFAWNLREHKSRGISPQVTHARR